MTERKISHCHKRIAVVAKEAAAESYEELMKDNLLFTTWKSQHPGLNDKRLRQAYVNAKWGLYIPLARATLALLLRQPIDDKIKEEIMEVLALDSTLIRGRVAPKVLVGSLKTQAR